MELEFGAQKPAADITDKDALEYPIWLWAWQDRTEANWAYEKCPEGNCLEGNCTEDCQVPVINSNNVDETLVSPTITLRIKGSDLIAAGGYDSKKRELFGISVWLKDSWELLKDSDLKTPITFVSVPTIDGITDVYFKCYDLNADAVSRW